MLKQIFGKNTTRLKQQGIMSLIDKQIKLGMFQAFLQQELSQILDLEKVSFIILPNH